MNAAVSIVLLAAVLGVIVFLLSRTSGCELYDALLLCTNVYPNVTLTESL